MAFEVPSTQPTGTLITSTMYAALTSWKEPPSVKVRNNAAQTVGTGTATDVTFDVEIFDTDSMWSSTADTQIKFNTAGKYLVGGSVSWNDAVDSTAGPRQLSIQRNNVDTLNLDNRDSSTTNTRQSVVTIDSFSTDDFIELVARQDSGTDVDLQQSSTSAHLVAFWATWQSS